jgi:orotidine-5'-phosphate decarboxylase
MVNVHASGGKEMMEAAREALEVLGAGRPRLIAVTVLTSMGQDGLTQIGVHKTPQQQVVELAKLTQQSGLDGVVCSAQEAKELKVALGKEFTLVTPGIRPSGSNKDDQKRIVTPSQAIQNGSDYLVIGRPITKAQNPFAALEAIHQSILG